MDDHDFLNLVANLREMKEVENDVLSSLMDPNDESSKEAIARMLGRPPDLAHLSTFEQLVYARLVFEVPFVKFEKSETGHFWMRNHAKQLSDLQREERIDLLVEHLRNSLWVFLLEDTRHNSILLGGGESVGRKIPALSNKVILGLHGFNKNGLPTSFSKNATSGGSGILPLFMDCSFRRDVCNNLLKYLDDNRLKTLDYDSASRIFSAARGGKLLPLATDEEYHEAIRGCGERMAEELQRMNPVPEDRLEHRFISRILPLRKIFDINQWKEKDRNSAEFIRNTGELFLANEFLSDEKVDEAFDSLNSVPFLPGRGGREGTVMRIIDYNLERSGFCTGSAEGNSLNWYPSDRPRTSWEWWIRDYVQRFMNAQNNYVRDKIGGERCFGEWKVNMLQINISPMTNGSYAVHDDSGPLLNRREETIDASGVGSGLFTQAEAQWFLPSRRTQQTLTTILTSDRGAIPGNHRIVWSDPAFRQPNCCNSVGDITTSHNCSHGQLAGLQLLGHKPETTPIGKSLGSNHVRVVISCRGTFCPIRDNADYQSALESQLCNARNLDKDTLPGEEMYEECKGAIVGAVAYMMDVHKKKGTGTSRPSRARGGTNNGPAASGILPVTTNKGRSGGRVRGRGLPLAGKKGPPAKKSNSNKTSDELRVEEDAPAWKKQHPTVKLDAKDFNDRYGKLSSFDYWKLGLNRSGQIFSLKGDTWRNLSSATATKLLLQQDHLVARSYDVRWTDKTSKKPHMMTKTVNSLFMAGSTDDVDDDGTYHPHIPERLGIYSVTTVSQSGTVTNGSRSHKVCGTTEVEADLLILSKGYKNEKKIVDSIIEGLINHFADTDSNCNFEKSNDGITINKSDRWKPLHVAGSGGSTVPSGTFCPETGKDTRDKPFAEFGIGQLLDSPWNKKLVSMVQRNAPVAIYVNLYQFYGWEMAKQLLTRLGHPDFDVKDACLFLGYYEARECHYKQDWFTKDYNDDGSPVDFISQPLVPGPENDCSHLTGMYEDDDKDTSGGIYCTYRQSPWFDIVFYPLFNDKEWEYLLSARLKRLVVPVDTEELVAVGFSSNFPAQRMLDPKHEFHLNRRTLLSVYIASHQWRIFGNVAYLKELGKLRQGGEKGIPNRELLLEKFADSSVPEDEITEETLSPQLVGGEVKLGGAKEVKWNAPGQRDNLQKLKPRDAVAACVFLSAAVALRFLGKSLTSGKKGEKVVTALPGDSFLPTPNQVHSTPCPNRSMDPLPLTAYSTAVKEKLVAEPVSSSDKSDRRAVLGQGQASVKELKKNLFRAVILRVTGRLNALSIYRHVTGRPEWTPDPDNYDDFVEFLKLACEKEKGGTTTHFRVKQHEGQIPHCLRNCHGLADFVQLLADKLDGTVSDMLNARCRQSALLIWTLTLMECCQAGDQAKLRTQCLFLGGQSMADVEEVFLDPFGMVTSESIPPGFGGNEGMKYMDIGDEDPSHNNSDVGKSKGRKKKSKGKATPSGPKKTPLYTGSRFRIDVMEQLRSDLENMGQEKFSKIGKQLLHKFQQMDEATLSVLFMFKREDGTIASCVNGREINLVDMEHFLCKIHIARAIVLSSRTISLQPDMHTKHCHPVKTYLGALPWEHIKVRLKRLANLSMENFVALRRNELLHYPQSLLYLCEKDDSGKRYPPSDEEIAERLSEMKTQKLSVTKATKTTKAPDPVGVIDLGEICEDDDPIGVVQISNNRAADGDCSEKKEDSEETEGPGEKDVNSAKNARAERANKRAKRKRE